MNVRFGSKGDINPNTQLRPLSGAKRTSNARFLSPKRSCADDVRYRGLSGLSNVTLRMSAYSQKRTFTFSKVVKGSVVFGDLQLLFDMSGKLDRWTTIDEKIVVALIVPNCRVGP